MTGRSPSGVGPAPSGLSQSPLSQAEPLVPNAGKLWFAAAVLSAPDDLRCKTAWGNISEENTVGFLVGCCREQFPGHSIIHYAVNEVDVFKDERRRRWCDRAGDMLCGAFAVLALISLCAAIVRVAAA